MNKQELIKNKLLLFEMAYELDEAMERTPTKKEVSDFIDYLTEIIVVQRKDPTRNLSEYAMKYVSDRGL